MKKIFLFLVFINFTIFVYSQQLMVAVTDFTAKSGYTANELTDITELFAGFLRETGNVRVVTRSQWESILKEHDFQRSGLVEQNEIREFGKALGAQAVVTGTLMKLGNNNILNLALLDVESGEMLSTARKQFESLDDFLKILPALADDIVTLLLKKNEEPWKHQWLYAGFNVGYTIQLNRAEYYDYYVDIPVGFSIYALVQPFNLFGVAIDLSGDMFDGPNISVVPTIIIRPSKFEIDLFLGIGYNLFYGATAFTGGTRIGYNLGPGVIYAEVRPTGIFIDEYIPINVNICLGYQIGFVPRKK